MDIGSVDIENCRTLTKEISANEQCLSLPQV